MLKFIQRLVRDLFLNSEKMSRELEIEKNNNQLPMEGEKRVLIIMTSVRNLFRWLVGNLSVLILIDAPIYSHNNQNSQTSFKYH